MEMLDTQRILSALVYLIALILSITVHEFGHAWVANRLGDRLARSQGRVTLNPLAHIDPIGTILFPLVGALTGLRVLGWGKPVFHALHPRHVPRHMSMATAGLLVSAAGPLMNILLALVLSAAYVVVSHSDGNHLPSLLEYVIKMNIGLAAFNLIPCPPLDGRSLLFWFLPNDHPVVRFLEQYGIYIFFALFMTGTFGKLMAPVYRLTDVWLHQLRILGL